VNEKLENLQNQRSGQVAVTTDVAVITLAVNQRSVKLDAAEPRR
jgi:hypothetical protein